MAYDGSLKFDTKLDKGGVESGLAELKSVATKSLAAIGAAAAAGIGAAIKVGMDFETSLAKVGTIADTNVKSLASFSGEVLNLSTQTGLAGTEINEALYQAISAGADTENALGLVEVAAKAAKGGFTDTATAVDGLTSVLNTYGMATSDAQKLANQFLITQNLGKTTFGELAGSIGLVAPVAKAAGVGTEELLSSIAALTANGLGTSEAITGVKAALSNIIKPSSEAAKQAKALGIDFSVAGLQSKGLAKFMAEVAEKTGGSTDKMAQLFGSVEGLNSVLTLTSSGGMALMNKTMQEMSTNTTALDDAYDQMNNTTEAAFNRLKTSAQGLGVSFYQGIQEPLKNAATAAGESLGQLAQSIQGGALKPAIESIGQMLGSLIATVTKLASAALPMLINTLSFVGQHFDTIAIAVTTCFAAMKSYAVINTISIAFQSASVGLSAYTAAIAANTAMQTRGITINALLASTLKPLELLVGVLTGKVSLATAAQAAWNAVISANPIGVLIASLTTAAGVFALFVKWQKSMISETEKTIDAEKEYIKKLNEQTEARKKAKEEQSKSIAANMSEASYIQSLARELAGLADASGNVQERDRARVQFILNELNAAFGTEYQLVDGCIQKYGELASSIDQAIAKMRLQAILNAMQQDYDNAVKNYKTQTDEVIAKGNELEEAQKGEVDAFNKYQYELEHGWAGSQNAARKAWEDSKTLLNQKQEAYDKAKNEVQQSLNDMGEYETLAAAMASGNYKIMAEAAKNYTNELVTADQLANQSTRERYDALGMQLVDAADKYGMYVGDMKYNNTDLANNMKSTYGEGLQKAVLEFVKGGGSLDEAKNYLQTQGIDIVNALGDGVKNGGPQFLEALSTVTGQSIESLKEYFGKNAPSIGEELDAGIAKGTENNKKVVNDSAYSVAEEANIAAENQAGQGAAGEVLATTTASGIESGSGEVSGAASGVMQGATDSASGAAGGASSAGDAFDLSVAGGISGGQGNLDSASTNAIQCTISAANGATSGASSVGTGIISGMVSGVVSAAQSLWNAAKSAVMGAIQAAKDALNINSPSRVTRDQIGKPLAEGITVGISKQAGNVASELVGSISGAIKSTRKAFGIHSPSRVTYDKLGVPLVDGITTAIKDRKYELKDAFKNALSDLDLLRDYDVISDAEYYRELEKLRDKYIKKGTEDWHKYTLELVKYDREQADSEFEIATKRYEKGEYNEKQYYKELCRIRDKYFVQNTNAWNEFNDSIIDEVMGRYNDHIGTLKDEIMDSFQEIADKATATFDEIKSAEDGLTSKLKDYGGLIQTNTYTGQGENGEDLVFKSLADLSEQTKDLEAYNDLLLSIKDRAGDGKADALFKAMRDMSIGDAAQLGQLLENASDDEFNAWLDNYNKKQQAAEDIAHNLFGGDYADAATEIYDEWGEQLQKSEAMLKDYFGEIPPEFFDCGMDSATQFGAGLIKGLDNVFDAIRIAVSDFTANISPQLSLGAGSVTAATAGGENYSPTYQIFNPTGDANAAIKAAKDREKLDRLRRLGAG